MSIDVVLSSLKRNRALAGDVIAWERVPARAARFTEPPAQLDASLTALLQRRGTWPLYTHQAQAVQAALAGKNVVVVTGTASGKTLCYNLVLLQMLRTTASASALYLFPTKALAQDQLAVLSDLMAGLGERAPLNLYDGDTPAAQRAAARKAGGVVLSNPDMLHAGILPHHTRWARFFADLQLIVLDEIHAYRGVFGSHLSNLLRRLRRICRFYGSDPSFICTSATIANPAAHAERLIEMPVTLVDDDGSPQGARHLILYNPPVVNPELGIRRSAVGQSVEIAGEFLGAGVQTILFCRSRLTTELALTTLREKVASQGSPAERIQGYRGGYLPRERREIERGLREGRVRGVVATNALELGVDIGELSACVLAGYPGTIASTRQQAGRVGRRLESSAAVLVATSSPIDQYIVTHPRYLLERNPEHALINPNNPVILLDHVKCGAYELPFEAGETFGGAGRVDEILDLLVEAGLLHVGRSARHWVAEVYPARGVSLRSGSSDTVVIQDTSDPGRPVVIGQMERESAPALLHEGAIYPHLARAYLVEVLDWEASRADVRPVEVEYYTRASVSSSLQVLEVEESAPVGRVRKQHGRVRVTSQATGYRKIKRTTHETLGWGEIDLPAQVLETAAYWLTLEPGLAAELEALGVLLPPIDYGPNWGDQRKAALARDGGRCQQCGARERRGQHHDVHHIQPFRTFSYLPGANDNYLQANALENLVTLCQACHRKTERGVRARGALAGLVSLLRNLAPLYLMCDARDIIVLAEASTAESRGPTVTVCERVPAGVGFSPHLYDVHNELLAAAQELIEACPCQDGCPSCVGPVGEVGPDTKAATLRLLDAVLE